MQNLSLARDYIVRSQKRLLAIETLMAHEAWADVVRESQEVVELSLKALLRHSKIEVPRIHDVSNLLEEERSRVPQKLQVHLKRLGEISRELRRDRELAFYGSEDLTPSEFYRKEDAQTAFKHASWVVDTLAPHID